jgi:hypothetical protein
MEPILPLSSALSLSLPLPPSTMDLAIQPEIYQPSVDAQGKYVDSIPSFHLLKAGLQCPCGSKKCYITRAPFVTHTQTKLHQKWLENINNNKVNYFVENAQLLETVQNQRFIIAKLEKELQTKTMAFDLLQQQTQQLYARAAALVPANNPFDLFD